MRLDHCPSFLKICVSLPLMYHQESRREKFSIQQKVLTKNSITRIKKSFFKNHTKVLTWIVIKTTFRICNINLNGNCFLIRYFCNGFIKKNCKCLLSRWPNSFWGEGSFSNVSLKLKKSLKIGKIILLFQKSYSSSFVSNVMWSFSLPLNSALV